MPSYHIMSYNIVDYKNSMLNKLFAEKKSRYKNLLLILLPFVIIAGILAYFSYVSARNAFDFDNTGNKASNVIEKYGYVLRHNATDYQKELFEELKDDFKNEEETDELKIAGDIAKNYVADFYTWTNKQGQFDVGGMCYINGFNKINYWMQSTNEFYKYITKYMETYGAEDLIEVESIEVVNTNIKNDSYEIDGVKNKSFDVELKWTYKQTEKFNTNKFSNHMHFTIVKDDYGTYSIVEAYES